MPGGGRRCQWPATAIEKSPFKRGCVVARRPLLCWFWESKSPKATLHSEVRFGIKVRNSHAKFHSASNVNESKALKKLQKYRQITDITFSCLDHTFPVHLFYLLYMQLLHNEPLLTKLVFSKSGKNQWFLVL